MNKWKYYVPGYWNCVRMANPAQDPGHGLFVTRVVSEADKDLRIVND